jgi:WD40 repeat protein
MARLSNGLVLLVLAAPACAELPDDAKGRQNRNADPLPKGAIVQLGSNHFRHPSKINDAAFSPDGKLIAAADSLNPITLWDAATGKQLRRFGEVHAPFRRLVFSPDGKTIVSDSHNGGICVWDVATGEERHHFETEKGLAASPCDLDRDGEMLAVGIGGQYIALLNPATGKELRRLTADARRVGGGTFSPDSKLFVTGSIVWDVVTGERVRFNEVPPEFHHLNLSVFSADGKILASTIWDSQPVATEDGRTVHLWDPQSGKRLARLEGHDAHVRSVAFSRNGKLLASISPDGVIIVWDVATRKQVRRIVDEIAVREFRGNRFGGNSRLAFSPDGATLLAWGADSRLTLWDVETGERRSPTEGHQNEVRSIVYSPDSRTLATGSYDRTVRLWDAGTGKGLRQFNTARQLVTQVAFSPDGKLLAAATDKDVTYVWDVAAGKELRRVGGRSVNLRATPCVAFSPVDGLLAIGGSDQMIHIGDPIAGKEVRTLRGKGHIGLCSVAFSPNGKLLASAHLSSVIQLWDATSGKQLELLDRKMYSEYAGIKALAFSPDGKTIAVGGSAYDNSQLLGNVAFWDVETKKLRRQLWGDGTLIHAIAYSPDGRMLVTGGIDRTIRLWELASGKERRRFGGDCGQVLAVTFSPTGQSVASGHKDGAAFVWDVTSRPSDRRPVQAALSPKDLESRWNELASDDASTAYQAICTLVRYPKQAVPLLSERLPSAAAADGQRIARLLVDLDSDTFETREKAAKELGSLGDLAVPALRQTIAGEPSAETRRRVERLLADPKVQEGIITSPDYLRSLRAVEILERIGTPGSRRALEALAKGAAAAPLTREAKAALERLDKRAGK